MTMNERIKQAAKEALGKFDSSEFFGGSYDAWQMEDIFADCVRWALAHQWISVDEELPEIKEEDGDVIVFAMADMASKKLPFVASYDGKEWHLDGYGFSDVTHWMEIPTLEGGEK